MFSLQLTPCYLFLDCFNCPVLSICGRVILEYSAGCMDRSLRRKNISEQKLSSKCGHSLKNREALRQVMKTIKINLRLHNIYRSVIYSRTARSLPITIDFCRCPVLSCFSPGIACHLTKTTLCFGNYFVCFLKQSTFL